MHGSAVAIATMLGGGSENTQTISGNLHLTSGRVDMVPDASGMRATVALHRIHIVSVRRSKFLGLIPRAPRLYISTKDELTLSIALKGAQEWVSRIQDAMASEMALFSASERLDTALQQGITDRERYTSVLSELSFPGGFWHVGAYEQLVDIVAGTLDDLGIPLPRDFVEDLLPTLNVERLVEDADEEPARRVQVQRLIDAVNAALPADETRRLYCFSGDLPGWEVEEALCVWLDVEQRKALVAAGIVTPL